MSEKKNCEKLPCVGCDVSACKYNTPDCRCTASRISVQNERAVTKGETYCSTFSPKSSC